MNRIESDAIYAALRERYCAPEYALFFEVANGTGSNIRRYADAMAMSLFPSRGLTMHGFEVKVSRSDWKRELDNPHKAEEGNFKYCDHWWIVTPPGIVQPGQLPPTWGHLELQSVGDLERGPSHKLRQKVAAPKLEARPMSRSFIAAFLRRADEANANTIRNQVNAQTRELREKLARVNADNAAAIQAEVDERSAHYKELADRVREFEEKTGLSIAGRYSLTPGAERLIKALKAAGFAATYGGLQSLCSTLAVTAEGVRKHLAEFDALAPIDKTEDAA